MKYKLLMVVLFSTLFSCQTIDFTYSLPDSRVINEYTQPYPFQKVNLSNWDKLERILPLNYKNINKDYTKEIQTFFNSHKNVILPDYPIFISNALVITSNTNVFFSKNSKIIYTGEVKGRHYDIIKIENVENVNLYNPNIIGNRNAKLLHKGEWNAGISIQNSRKIRIYNPMVKNTWGDGIFIGSETASFSEDVIIEGGWIDNVRRNGISITSAKDVFIKNILISNVNGTNPQCGIDVEPSLPEDFIKNVNLNKVYTFNNALSGIAINMNALNQKSKDKVKNVSININNHTDNRSSYALLTSLNTENSIFDPSGVINISNTTWINNKNDSYWKSETKQAIKLNFKNIKIDSQLKSKSFFNTVNNSENLLYKN
ncbi:right-handed parallel beta-helix repeat-containing protein [Chryseobacterium indologenes]|uniref:right-handed parallel beta-helix repeat-containing protein n=1 Tax=Chryseobacterium indologenes TaxID=253 RepID=UPI0003E06FAD|nr:right-handed parallel beta-helix repeat-containing protein [Chryseobacterium indologenes]QPQ52427.1 right-handed parallel beta-helix repeat-containing protein [Chryseobacterium indologenes]GAE64704.1 hypothetical protein CIN01S_09_01890 [Chryseobacterium indologenes NBRC 14944]SFJ85182.1 Right handed beta helix region [Chryseobacterium indologenes]SUX51069.1 Uncharacterised protein [Chryseobacterium indologenes]